MIEVKAGEWVLEIVPGAEPFLPYRVQVSAFDEQGNRILAAPVDSHNAVKDARLMATAPKLLAAAKRLVANLEEGEFISITRIDELKAAITLAEGE